MPFPEQKAATTIQRIWRGHQARKKFGVKQLAKHQQMTGQTYVVGNDPKIKGLAPHAIHEGKIALIGTSGLRALALALELNQSAQTPKIIIVDLAQEVVLFWKGLREVVASSREPGEFMAKFIHFLSSNKQLYRDIPNDALTMGNRDGLEYEKQDPMLYMQALTARYSAERVMKTIKHVSIIAQTWTDPMIFTKLRNICQLNGVSKIVAYPSNIAHCVLPSDRDNVFASLEHLSADLSIVTDVCLFHGVPERVVLSEAKTAKEIKDLVFPPASRAAAPMGAMPSLEMLMMLGTSDPMALRLLLMLMSGGDGPSSAASSAPRFAPGLGGSYRF